MRKVKSYEDFVNEEINLKKSLVGGALVASLVACGPNDGKRTTNVEPYGTERVQQVTKTFDELPATFTKEEEMQIMCNFLYLKEILSVINSPDVNIFVKDSNFPMIIKDSETDSFFYVLMPMKF